MNTPGIRVIALGLIRDGDRLFLSQGYDSVKQETFYRALGGGVEFGETSQEALEREFLEELNVKLTNICYLGCLENLFVFNGKKGHEIVQVYQCDFVDPKFYQAQSFTFSESDQEPQTALWMDIKQLKSGEARLVPELFLAYL